MLRFPRAGLALAAALLLTSSAASRDFLPRFKNPFGGQKAPAQALAERARLPAGQWPQTRSDVAADPEIRFGALPNGMRYALRRQTIPAGQAAIRLRIDAGSLDETDAQQGLAHFLEHMAFNGSKAMPEGEMVKALERLGLAFGPDTNASTDFSETIYKLDLPRTNPETVDTALTLMRETAGNLLIDSGAVDRERGVVMSEERARDTPAYRIYKARTEFLFRGQLPPQRFPIGKVEVLKSAPASQIADFYRRYYRPERTVLVAVGDFDLDELEAKVKARFADWEAPPPAGEDPNLGPVAPRGPEARLVVEPGAPPSLQLAWLSPPDRAADSLARRRRDLVEYLGFAVLNRRLSRLARDPRPPFLGAAAFKTTQFDAADVTMISVNAELGRWKPALEAVEQEARRAVEHGVRQDELDREIAELRAMVKSAVAGAATRRPSQLAAEILGTLEDDEVVTSPAQDAALFEAAVKGLKAEQVSAALETALKGQGPLLFMASPTEIPGGEPAVLAALQASRKTAVAAPATPTEVAWPYQSFGEPGKVAEQREIADLDAVFVRFENGVRLTVKPTRFRDDEVLVRVNVGNGLMDLPGDRQSAAWGSGAFIEGGLKQISAEDMERVLASNIYGARFSVTDDAFVLSGTTRPEDLLVQAQVLAGYVAEPGWRPEAFARVQNGGKTIHDQFESTASGVLSRDLSGLLHAGDRRWTFPSRDEIARAKAEDLQAQVAPALAAGAIEVVVVGDTTVENAIKAVAATFGALPPRPAPALPDPGLRKVGFPAPSAVPLKLTHKGRADQALGYIAWPTDDFFADPQRARETSVMGEVLNLRLLDELREAQGATYSPSVSYTHSLVWPGWGYVAASVEVPPDKLSAFFTDVEKIAASLRASEVAPDELERAKLPRIERLEKARVTNQYWLSELSGAQADGRRLDAVRSAVAGVQRVSAADVKRAAETTLRDERVWKLQVAPK